jgi:hypothetical protein
VKLFPPAEKYLCLTGCGTGEIPGGGPGAIVPVFTCSQVRFIDTLPGETEKFHFGSIPAIPMDNSNCDMPTGNCSVAMIM